MPDNNQIVYFELFRYQLLPLTRHLQAELFQEQEFLGISSIEDLKAKKNEILEYVLSNFPTLHHRSAVINHKIDLHEPPWFVVELNTRKSLSRDRPDFKKEKLDTWPQVIVVINNQPDVQLIAISRNQKAFSSGDIVAKMFRDTFNRVLRRFALTMQVEAIFDESEFWKLVKENEGRITSINFELISPNMSNISNTLEIDLRQLNADTNSHLTNLKLNSSKGGTLEINHDNSLVNSIVEYSSLGGGDIELRLRGVKKTIRTSRSVTEISIDEVSVRNLTSERLRWFLGRFL